MILAGDVGKDCVTAMTPAKIADSYSSRRLFGIKTATFSFSMM